MRKIKDFLVVFTIISTIIFGAISIEGVSNSMVSAADDILSVEQYTDSDFLLESDGKHSTKKIKDFALEVKNGKEGDYFPELAEVIPRQYLESDADNATLAGIYGYREYSEDNT